MLVERESVGEPELIYYHFARAVGEAPFLVGVSAKHLPGGKDIVFSQVIEFG